ncbi:MAG: hypothetical protein AUJ55_02275 [Proteobacteria bacterium CG1_02_64_396]|nr:MAG: hypothetical protein AUJ55_02275 [Proteobacteria bacterium CG1_02_64_396]
MNRLEQRLLTTLTRLDTEHRRRRETVSTPSPLGGRRPLGAAPLWDLSSNDYLGLSRHPEVVAAACAAGEHYGVGATGSRLMTGTTPLHLELEAALAALKGCEAALVFPAGFQTNLTLLSALTTRDDLLFTDRLNHASLIDGAAACPAKVHRFRHNDLNHLSDLLAKHPPHHGIAFIVVDAVFSMDGDMAPLPEILALAERFDAVVVIDDAHGSGVLGQGRGTAHHLGVAGHPRLIVMGTLSKALGAQGGFVAASTTVVEGLRNLGRGYIFTTALSPMVAGGALKAVEIAAAGEACATLQTKATALRAALADLGLPLTGQGPVPIVPVVVGLEAGALGLSGWLREQGYFVQAIRPPTVPVGSSRLRITVRADLPDEVLARLPGLVAEGMARLGG